MIGLRKYACLSSPDCFDSIIMHLVALCTAVFPKVLEDNTHSHMRDDAVDAIYG